MDYPIKTLTQLRPILRGFRKAAGLTQAAMAGRLGITQQSYAQLEANPALASVERLFKVMRMLDVEMCLIQTAAPRPSRASSRAQTDSADSGRLTPTAIQKAGRKTVARKTSAQTAKVQRARAPLPAITAARKKENW
ncbi:helix-turn-helix transcriptional regulator [Paraburkholderia saeva]|uniref:HTH cro/C1-type domain-containing protein n=1 Tax=Paraburkholderia saeva TaxID=2777537 RepID=A0A9N8RZ87_9BURK|nr:helix-turn-helix domain-containing protein [Paraburkholderia saeva]CAG4888970.1 hypothetical protein R52603_00826 [Paraburkholderia saeva]CAG4894065.1 hypothetical protein R70241_01710 [Paraburkholderia saeva]CAG4916750.1 hypothetical protein LMG31841_04609 [Paraburkholderia saeva]